MKKVIDLSGNEIEVDDGVTVKTINGVHYLHSSEETSEIATRDAEFIAGAPKRTALAEIERLESEVTQRRLREAALGTDDGWLANQDALIATERSKL